MRVLQSRDEAPRNYWRFPWVKWKSGVTTELKPLHDIAGRPVRDRKGNQIFDPHLRPKDERTVEVYYPLEQNPGISREFSLLRTLADVQQFANRYGQLGYERRPGEIGENVRWWISDASLLRQLFDLWDLVKARDVHKLRRIVQSSGDGSPWWTDKAWLKTLKPPDDLIGAAKLYIVDTYNRRMHRMASPALLIDSLGNLRAHSVPVSLLGAIWLEFGEIVTGVRRLIQCELCSRMMDVTENRKHKRVHDECSKRFRMARWRNKSKPKKRAEHGKKKRAR
jgi:hypothetical protein